MTAQIENDNWTVGALIETLEGFPKDAPIVGETNDSLHHLAGVNGPIGGHNAVSFVFGSFCPIDCPRCTR